MLNILWIGMMLIAVIIGGINGTLHEVMFSVSHSVVLAINLALILVVVSSVWLGLMKIAENAGLIKYLSKLLRPVITRIFPDVPAEHPATDAMILNIAATMLGLNNAATPFGIRAMVELDKLNPFPGTATNAMCTYLAIKTANEQLIPVTAMALLAGAGATHPYIIIPACMLTSLVALIVGVSASRFLQRLKIFKPIPEGDNVLTDVD